MSLLDRDNVVGAGQGSLLGDRRCTQLHLYRLSAHQLNISWDNSKAPKTFGNPSPIESHWLEKSPPLCSLHEKVYLTCGHAMNAVPLHFCRKQFEGKQLAVGLAKFWATNLKLLSYSETYVCKNTTFLLNRYVPSVWIESELLTSDKYKTLHLFHSPEKPMQLVG